MSLTLVRIEKAKRRRGVCNAWAASVLAAIGGPLLLSPESFAQAPAGACCDWVNTDANGEAVCRDVALSECPARPGGEPPQWIEGASCESEPFDPPCGVAACCYVRASPYGDGLEEVCENLSRDHCESQLHKPNPPIWQPGEHCSMKGQRCPRDPCLSDHPQRCFPGECRCIEEFCNTPVGSICCNVIWDPSCCAFLELLCEPFGACCDWVNTDVNGEAVCRDVALSECPARPGGDPPQWVEGVSCESEPFDPPCGKAACCHYREDAIYGACLDFTKSECYAQPPTDRYRDWQPGKLCGIGDQVCPRLACRDSDECCSIEHDSPGCNDEDCCNKICAPLGGGFCCNVAWDSACVDQAQAYCSIGPPNDSCIPDSSSPCANGAIEIAVPGRISTSNTRTQSTPDEPGFCCHNGLSECVGGTDEGEPCIVDTDCWGGKCPLRTPTPGAQGYGTMWFKFVQGAGTSAAISTCTSNSPALDSILQVFAVGDNSSPEAACNSLAAIGCNDDAINCGSLGRNSRLCLRDLTPGATYYIMVAAKTPNRQGQYIVTVSPSCSGPSPSCTHCPAGEVVFVNPPDGVVDARRTHDRNNSDEGIKKVVVEAPAGASKGCWTVCAGGYPSQDLIIHIEEDPPGLYTLYFLRPISAGDATLITYAKDQAYAETGRFFFHPGNVNGDTKTNPNDILDLVDHLNGVKSLPWGLFSGDLDHSGVIGPADIITLIDLLNGANGFAVWYGTTRPEAKECP